jgi:GT2 family glycosyltransferase
MEQRRHTSEAGRPRAPRTRRRRPCNPLPGFPDARCCRRLRNSTARRAVHACYLPRTEPGSLPGRGTTTSGLGDPENRGILGLPEVYNNAIDTASDEDMLVFVHDDVYIHDWFLKRRVQEALDSFDVVGLAGSVNPNLREPSWGLEFDHDLRPTGWQPNLVRSGVVNHFDYAAPSPSRYGPTPKRCQLLDGLLIAVQVGRLEEAGVRFDPDFRYHLYDLDFCRTATAAGLRLGTWPIAVTHNSAGGFDTEAFRHAASMYLNKWDD